MILSLLLPIFLGKIVDNFGKENALNLFFIFSLIYLSNFILHQISGFFRTTISITHAPRYLFQKALSRTLDTSNIDITPEKEMDKIFSFGHIFEFFYNRFAIFVFITPFLMLFSIAMILVFEWKVGIVAIMGFILMWISSDKKVKTESKIADQMNEAEYKVSETISDLYLGYEDIKSYETIPFTIKWVQSIYNKLVKKYDLYGKTEITYGITYEFLSTLTTPLIILLLGLQVFLGKITPGIAIMLFSYVERIESYSQVFVNDTDYISWAVARAKVAYNEYLKENDKNV
jgi:ABC-type bacteriocin/lantibiotic exporter with double-glycine peptidase domain